VAELVLASGRELTEGTAFGRDVEEGIISEAGGTPGAVEDEALAVTPRDELVSVRVDQCDSTGVAGGSARRRDISQSVEESGVVGRVELRAGQVGAPGESSGAYTGFTGERIDTETGIVGKRGHPGAAREVTGFRESIFLEGGILFERVLSRFFREVDVGECAEPLHWQGSGEDLLELSQFGPIAGGYEEQPAAHRTARRCTAMSSAIAELAVRTMVPSSSGVNGLRSAVPCTSMSLPDSRPTTFRSTSAEESSE
jgi:hypothetical protein